MITLSKRAVSLHCLAWCWLM
uniref:Uncharacterized protein n=1 Tax=Arundo donax TaxID=35708 RepID=A0A0A9AML1_ARUDO